MTSAVSKHDALLTSALHLGWTVLEVPRVSQIGPPFIKDMYLDAARRFPNCLFYAYANGDILFGRGLTDTLLAVTEVKTLQLVAKTSNTYRSLESPAHRITSLLATQCTKPITTYMFYLALFLIGLYYDLLCIQINSFRDSK